MSSQFNSTMNSEKYWSWLWSINGFTYRYFIFLEKLIKRSGLVAPFPVLQWEKVNKIKYVTQILTNCKYKMSPNSVEGLLFPKTWLNSWTWTRFWEMIHKDRPNFVGCIPKNEIRYEPLCSRQIVYSVYKFAVIVILVKTVINYTNSGH